MGTPGTGTRTAFRERQTRWAKGARIPTEKERVRDLEDNFYLGAPHPNAWADFEAAGVDAESLFALDSPLVLLCNLFDPFRDRDIAPLARALGADPATQGLSFLQSGTDVLLEGDDATPTAILSTTDDAPVDERAAAILAAHPPGGVRVVHLSMDEMQHGDVSEATGPARIGYAALFEALRREAPEMHRHQRYLRARYFPPAMDETQRARLADATAWSASLHAGQVRKGTGIPYWSHVSQVAALVLEHGGNVDEAIAGLLHDAIEDSGVTRAEIEARFGPVVAGIVEECTDLLPGDSPERKAPWEARKRRYVEHLEQADAGTRLVAACDKLHNLRCIVSDLREEGDAMLRRFNASPDQTLWYQREVWRALGEGLPIRLRREAQELLVELEAHIEG
ncbi:MAG: HD domain-containing protein [Myxococcota bacterium]|nr:HD domain-containing protein [Myxococcota bacterium]